MHVSLRLHVGLAGMLAIHPFERKLALPRWRMQSVSLCVGRTQVRLILFGASALASVLTSTFGRVLVKHAMFASILVFFFGPFL